MENESTQRGLPKAEGMECPVRCPWRAEAEGMLPHGHLLCPQVCRPSRNRGALLRRTGSKRLSKGDGPLKPRPASTPAAGPRTSLHGYEAVAPAPHTPQGPRPGRGCGPRTLLPDGVSCLTLTAREGWGRADVAENSQPWSRGSWRRAGAVMRRSHAPGQPALGRGYRDGGRRARPLQGQSARPTLPRAAGPPPSVQGDARWAPRRHIRLPRGSARQHRKGPRGKRGPDGKPRDASHSLGALWGRCRDPCKGPHPPAQAGRQGGGGGAGEMLGRGSQSSGEEDQDLNPLPWFAERAGPCRWAAAMRDHPAPPGAPYGRAPGKAEGVLGQEGLWPPSAGRTRS